MATPNVIEFTANDYARIRSLKSACSAKTSRYTLKAPAVMTGASGMVYAAATDGRMLMVHGTEAMGSIKGKQMLPDTLPPAVNNKNQPAAIAATLAVSDDGKKRKLEVNTKTGTAHIIDETEASFPPVADVISTHGIDRWIVLSPSLLIDLLTTIQTSTTEERRGVYLGIGPANKPILLCTNGPAPSVGVLMPIYCEGAEKGKTAADIGIATVNGIIRDLGGTPTPQPETKEAKPAAPQAKGNRGNRPSGNHRTAR